MKQKKIEELVRDNLAIKYDMVGYYEDDTVKTYKENIVFDNEVRDITKQIKQIIAQELLVKKGFVDRFRKPTKKELDRVKYQNELIEEQLKILEKL